MKYLFALLAVFALTFSAQAQQPTARDIIKLALGVSDTQLPKVYEAWGKKLNTVDTTLDTVWDISPVTDSLGVTTLDSVVSHVNETRTPRPAYAYEILSEWRKQTIDEWKAMRLKEQRDSVEAVAKQSVPEPTF